MEEQLELAAKEPEPVADAEAEEEEAEELPVLLSLLLVQQIQLSESGLH